MTLCSRALTPVRSSWSNQFKAEGLMPFMLESSDLTAANYRPISLLTRDLLVCRWRVRCVPDEAAAETPAAHACDHQAPQQ